MVDIKKKKAFTRDFKNTVRIGPRISKPLYVLAKYVYSLQSLSLEERLEDLIRKDVEYAMKQKWFTDMAASAEGRDLQLFMTAFVPHAPKIQRREAPIADVPIGQDHQLGDWESDRS